MTHPAHKIGQKGQVVIPKELRDELQLLPATPVAFSAVDGELRIRPRDSVRTLRGSLKDGPDLAALLLEDRAKEPR